MFGLDDEKKDKEPETIKPNQDAKAGTMNSSAPPADYDSGSDSNDKKDDAAKDAPAPAFSINLSPTAPNNTSRDFSRSSDAAASEPSSTSAPQTDNDDDKTDNKDGDKDDKGNATLADGDDLLSIKQKALIKLEPLVDQLDQPPEEKFKTLLMMIQASDNENLIKDAFDEASKIEDDKARAQALLDIINEVNYFTQNQKSGDSE